eukprot:GILJ01018870.1.p1 GENE.GILJ01018870.1~~GILJ01018870.1.p1  ORF type:complete len:724 (-),score=67.92 GILJ01018870.1:43-1926(-)
MQSTQAQVWEKLEGNIDLVLGGYNCAIFTYGQTGAGKTYTMQGPTLPVPDALDNTGSQHESKGIVPRAIDSIFAKMMSGEGSEDRYVKTNVYCSYIQIYNEQIYDLLQPSKKMPHLVIREEMKKGKRSEIFVEGLAEFPVRCPDDVYTLLWQGDKHRAVRHTELNDFSSRSHTIFQLNVEQTNTKRPGVVRRSKLNLVDLAGSEKPNTNERITGVHAKEMAAINQSLSCLGNCVSALTEHGRRHVPFRDSKLTRLLQDTLGGNCRTTIVCNISPSLLNYEETASTMKFANRARHIRTNARVNDEHNATMVIQKYEKEISTLRHLLTEYSKGRGAVVESQLLQLQNENESLKEKLRLNLEKMSCIEQKVSMLHQPLPAPDELVTSGSRSGFYNTHPPSRFPPHVGQPSKPPSRAMELNGGTKTPKLNPKIYLPEPPFAVSDYKDFNNARQPSPGRTSGEPTLDEIGLTPRYREPTKEAEQTARYTRPPVVSYAKATFTKKAKKKAFGRMYKNIGIPLYDPVKDFYVVRTMEALQKRVSRRSIRTLPDNTLSRPSTGVGQDSPRLQTRTADSSAGLKFGGPVSYHVFHTRARTSSADMIHPWEEREKMKPAFPPTIPSAYVWVNESFDR